MDSAAAPSGLWATHGFVNTVQLNTTDTNIWNKSTGISFVLFMVIGFCATLGAIGLAVVAYLIYRHESFFLIQGNALWLERFLVF